MEEIIWVKGTADSHFLRVVLFLNAEKCISSLIIYCSFFAEEPEELMNLQKKEWQPLIDWFGKK